MKKINLLDCTLRDGAYIVESKFGAPAIKGIISKLNEAGVDIIECGWLKDSEYEQDTTFYHVPGDLKQYLLNKNSNKCYVAMIDWDRYNVDALPYYDGETIDAIRVVFPFGKHREGAEIGKKIKEKGYKIFFQAANTLAYSDDDLVDLAKEINKVKPVSLSVVDTFGAMYREDLERIVKVLDRELDRDIKLGFHSHNNQQLSFALTIDFIELLKNSDRDMVIDSSLCGMGRGAGNATTELVVSYLNRKCGCHYNMDAIMDAIDIYIGYFQENYKWGYSTPYFIAGMYCCHVNNIAYLLDNHRTNSHDLRNIIESLAPEDRKKYDYDLLEKKYLDNQSRHVDDGETVSRLREEFSSRDILLIAPGISSVNEYNVIQEYISGKKPLVIGINAILQGYDYDYMFFVNSARYEYAKKTYSKEFYGCKRIVLSNIKTEPDSGECIVNYNSVIRRGWRHFDNAAICCLRFMDLLGVKKVSIAGFDSFKSGYNESYGDTYLPSLNPGKDFDSLNAEIGQMFREFRKNAVSCKDITFVTESAFGGE